MAGDAELCGFLDAKIPGGRGMSQRVMKRSLASWKVWKRHWCSVRKLGPGLGLEVRLDCGIGSNSSSVVSEKDNSIKVPSDAILCRTESRSKQFAFGIFPSNERKPLLYLSGVSETETQRWMANIRHLLKPRKHRFMEGTYNMSMVDNSHSRAAGLTGLHGDLVAGRTGVFIKDVNSGEIVKSLDWKDMNQFHLSTAGRPEDVKRICVIHTTKEFRGGVGELHIFCLDAARLLQDLVTQGRGPKHRHVEHQRPLSLSEGDLRLSIYNEDGDADSFPVLKSKVASSLIHAGLGLLLSARSGSEAKLPLENCMMLNKPPNVTIHTRRAIDNVYQPEPACASSISLEELEETSAPRRVSNISVASGIYEEILDDVDPSKTIRVPSNLYEDPEEIFLASSAPNIPLLPPPLPPRQRCGSSSTRNGSISDDGLDDSEGGTIPTPEEKSASSSCNSNSHSVQIDTSDYVPMSPRLKDIALHQLQQQTCMQEEVYMVMR